MAAGALGGNTAVGGLRPDSVQGDRACLELFKAFGAQVSFKNGTAFTSGSALHGIDIDASQIPDLVPILAVTAALAQGKSRIYGAERLRIKESDRLSAIANALNAAGGRVTVTADGLLIEGVKSLNSCKVEGCNDHRIVMAMSVAAIKADGFIEITDAMSINKSYPRFFEDFKQLGGTADVINLG
jgi:3-phosphoshikimate 1-carboxyvinyltransferase